MNNTAKNRLYTYADYKHYHEGESIEIVDGNIYNMSLDPSRIHQKIIIELSTIINNYIKSNNGECEIYPAPFDVFLSDGTENIDECQNIVQPDVSVICNNKNKLTDNGSIGIN